MAAPVLRSHLWMVGCLLVMFTIQVLMMLYHAIWAAFFPCVLSIVVGVFVYCGHYSARTRSDQHEVANVRADAAYQAAVDIVRDIRGYPSPPPAEHSTDVSRVVSHHELLMFTYSVVLFLLTFLDGIRLALGWSVLDHFTLFLAGFVVAFLTAIAVAYFGQSIEAI